MIADGVRLLPAERSQGFFSTNFVNNPHLEAMILTMRTPGFDVALLHNLRMAATATVID